MHFNISQAAVREANIHRTRAMASSLDREFAKTQAGLVVLSTAPLLLSNELSGFYRQASGALKNISADGIVLLDSETQMLLSTRRRFGTALPKLGSAPLQSGIWKADASGVSDLFIDPHTGTPIVTVEVPVYSGNKLTYSLSAILEPARLASILSEQKFPDNWRAAIADRDGDIAARSHNITKYLGKKVTAELAKRIMVSDEGALETVTLDGIKVVTFYSRAPVSHWIVVLGIPVSELDAGISSGLAWLAGACFAALGVGLVFAWLIGGAIATSIRNLVAPARALGLGKTVRIQALSFREADEVGRALVEAAECLERSKYAAMHDNLTGLPNRNAFHLTIKHQLAVSLRNATGLAVLYIDLDGFKMVNDTYGHACGDMLLRAVADRLTASIRGSDLAARLGGDEFAILLVQADPVGAAGFAGRLVDTLSQPYLLNGVSARISASIGVACAPDGDDDADMVIKHADKAMYRAKALGKSRVCVSS